MKEALVFNLQKFCVHDGPGIRTTIFFKGCPLACSWCHNPESQRLAAEISCNSELCNACGSCVSGCPQNAVKISGAKIATDAALCLACGNCGELCLQNARQLIGKSYDVAELVALAERDRPFYEESGGGVTLSGGEVLSQGEAAVELARQLHSRGIHLAVDTCGHGSRETLQSLLPWTDLFLYDLKQMDDAKHRRHTGQGNALILANLRFLLEAGAKVALRLPLVAGVNDDAENIAAVLAFMAEYPPLKVHLLPYHAFGSDKRCRLAQQNSACEVFTAPAAERIDEIARLFSAARHEVMIGG